MPTRGNVHTIRAGQQRKISYTPFQLRFLSSLLGLNSGSVFFVDSGGGGADATAAGTFEEPFLTMNYADTRAAANNGDVVFVKAGHVETVTAAAGLDLNTAGVTWIAEGVGASRATVNYTTAVGADMNIDGANITMRNFLFTGGIDALTGPIDVNAADFQLLDCEWRDVTGQVVDCIVADANADRLLVDGFYFQGALTAGSAAAETNSCIVLTGNDRPRIVNSTFVGRIGIACIECRTTAVVMLECMRCKFVNLDNRVVGTAGVAIEDVITGSTGFIGPDIEIYLQTDGANITEAITGATFRLVDPIYVVNANNEKALLINWTASADA